MKKKDIHTCDCGGRIKMHGFDKKRGYLYKCNECGKDWEIHYISDK